MQGGEQHSFGPMVEIYGVFGRVRNAQVRTIRATHRKHYQRIAQNPVLLLFLLLVVAIWGFLLWMVKTSLDGLHPALTEIGPQRLPDKSPLMPTTTTRDRGITNPYFGWQPIIPTEKECSWRECFKPNHTCSTCRDLAVDWMDAPNPPSNWIPDVTMLYRMRLQGKDSQGNPWPPPLDSELCENIGNFGGKQDDNRECKSSTASFVLDPLSYQYSAPAKC